MMHSLFTERCAESNNEKLKKDLKDHKIPERMEKIAGIITYTHYHDWNQAESSKGAYSFSRCIEKEDEWNSSSDKVGMVVAGAVGSVFLLGIPSIITGVMVYKIISHANEVGNQLEFVVKEINSLYKHISGLIQANNIK